MQGINIQFIKIKKSKNSKTWWKKVIISKIML